LRSARLVTRRALRRVTGRARSATDTIELPIDDPDLPAALVEGSLREGYRTAWGSDPGALGLPIAAHLAALLDRLVSRHLDIVDESASVFI
jgi:hypothetical protein